MLGKLKKKIEQGRGNWEPACMEKLLMVRTVCLIGKCFDSLPEKVTFDKARKSRSRKGSDLSKAI